MSQSLIFNQTCSNITPPPTSPAATRPSRTAFPSHRASSSERVARSVSNAATHCNDYCASRGFTTVVRQLIVAISGIAAAFLLAGNPGPVLHGLQLVFSFALTTLTKINLVAINHSPQWLVFTIYTVAILAALTSPLAHTALGYVRVIYHMVSCVVEYCNICRQPVAASVGTTSIVVVFPFLVFISLVLPAEPLEVTPVVLSIEAPAPPRQNAFTSPPQHAVVRPTVPFTVSPNGNSSLPVYIITTAELSAEEHQKSMVQDVVESCYWRL